MMKITLYLSLLAICLNGCLLQQPQKKDLHIPDSVAVTKTDKHKQMPGSQIFIVPPKGTAFDKSISVIRLDKNADIQFLMLNHKSFREAIADHVEKYISPKSKKSDIQYHKQFKLGSDSATIIYGAVPKNKTDKIVMVVGNEIRSALITCTLPENRPELMKEMLTALQTIYLDPEIIIDYEAIAPYTADFSNSPFTFSHRDNELAYYTSASNDSAITNTIIIMPFSYPLSQKELDVAIIAHKSKLEEKKILSEKTPNEKVIINGHRGAESSFRGNYPEGEANVYVLYLSNDKSTILYTCFIDPSDKALFETAKSLAKNIRLK